MWRGPAAVLIMAALLVAPVTLPASADKAALRTFIYSRSSAKRLAAYQNLVRRGMRLSAILTLIKTARPRVLPRLNTAAGRRLLRAILQPPPRPSGAKATKAVPIPRLKALLPKGPDVARGKQLAFLNHGVVNLVLSEAYLKRGLAAEAVLCLESVALYGLRLEAAGTDRLHRILTTPVASRRFRTGTEAGAIKVRLGRYLRSRAILRLGQLILVHPLKRVRLAALEGAASLCRRMPVPKQIFDQALKSEKSPRVRRAVNRTLKRCQKHLPKGPH